MEKELIPRAKKLSIKLQLLTLVNPEQMVNTVSSNFYIKEESFQSNSSDSQNLNNQLTLKDNQ